MFIRNFYIYIDYDAAEVTFYGNQIKPTLLARSLLSLLFLASLIIAAAVKCACKCRGRKRVGDTQLGEPLIGHN